jgi:hypothetical protein
LSYWAGTYWKEFDNFFLKPKLIYRWPLIKEEHDEIANIIKTEIEEYKSIKKKKTTHECEFKEMQEIKIDTPDRSRNRELISEDAPIMTLFTSNTNPNTASKSKLATP